jgi:lysophospholipase L1-like esterase
VEFVGGWAAPGATTTEMVAGVQPMAADVLVMLAGTNDLAKAAAWPVTEANLLQIGAKAGVPTVLLSAVPPRNTAPAQTRQLNAHLEQLARTHGWAFVDPWADMSTDGAWMAETSDDGIHPNEQVAALVGDRLAAAIAAASRSPQP